MSPPSSTRSSATSIEMSCGPASRTSRRSPWPHTCTPAIPCTEASAPESMSTADSRSIGPSDSLHTTRPGSSSTRTIAVSGRRVATNASSIGIQACTTSDARRNAIGAGIPASHSARPRVSGPVSWSFTRGTGAGRCSTTSTKANRPPCAATSKRGSGRCGVDRGIEMQRAVCSDADLGESDGPLGHHELTLAAVRQLGSRRKAGGPDERDLDGRMRVGVRKRSDARRESGNEHGAERCFERGVRSIGHGVLSI